MHTSFLAVALSTFALVNAQSGTEAPIVKNNPIGTTASAQISGKGALKGSVSAVTGANGEGVKFDISLSGLPAEGGPFMYHIHEKPVPADGNCTGTGAHLDPYKRGEKPACDAEDKANCQVGDLSGKYGNFSTAEYSSSYTDDFLSLDPSNPAYFGNLAIVVHLANKTRIGCANFSVAAVPSSVPSSYPSSGATAPGYGNSTSAPTATGTGSGSAPTPTGPVSPPLSTGAASRMGVSAGAAAVLAVMAWVL